MINQCSPKSVKSQIDARPNKVRLRSKCTNQRQKGLTRSATKKSIQTIKVSKATQPSVPLLSKGIPLKPILKKFQNPLKLVNAINNLAQAKATLGISMNSSNSGIQHSSWLSMTSAQTKSPDVVLSEEQTQRVLVANKSENYSQTEDGTIFPITPSQALQEFQSCMTSYEISEILDYQNVYFIGQGAKKIQDGRYDDERFDYKVVIGDHICYRFQILKVIGKGSFGQVLQVKDHKSGKDLAIKIIRNRKRFHYQARIEIKILEYIKSKDRS